MSRYQITIERVSGFRETRETFEVRATTDTEARACAETECRIAGCLATVVNVRLA